MGILRRGTVAVAALAGCLLLPAGADAGRAVTGPCRTVFCAGVSQDGSRVVFPFEEELVLRLGKRQIYSWSAEKTRALLPARLGHLPRLDGISADATHVFVSTNLALAPEDTDGSGVDLFDISARGAGLISTGPLDASGGSGAPASFIGSSPDGQRVFFDAFSPLTPDDLDACPDLYMRFAGQTALIGPNPDPPAPPLCESAVFAGMSKDGTSLFILSGNELEPGDERGEDIYQLAGASPKRLTTYPEPEGECAEQVKFADASRDGGTVLFSTNAQVVAEDTDSAIDVYKRRPDGTFSLVSRGTDGGNQPCGPFGGDRPVALSADGSASVFETTARLNPADTDSSNDLYGAYDSGAIELISTGPTDANVDEHSPVFPDWLALASDDAKRVAFETRQRLVTADKDAAPDVYLRAAGRTELISSGLPGKAVKSAAELLGLSGDGSTIVFATSEPLLASDLDRERDVYLRRSGQRRSVLLSGETISPELRIARRGTVTRSGRVRLTLSCPKVETSGPCRGKVALRKGRLRIGVSSFRIASGRRARVSVRLRPRFSATRSVSVWARAIDALGNSKVATGTVRLVTGGNSKSRGALRKG